MKSSANAALILVPIFLASSIFVGCDYRLFDLAEYPELSAPPTLSQLESKPTESNFESVFQTVLRPKCLSCHSPGKKAEDVPLDTYQDLVDSPGDQNLVVAGKPENSILYTLLLPTAKRRMPPVKSGLPAVDSSRAEAIRVWILNGAPEK